MKHFAAALMGWYLLLPPWVAPYRVNENAPYSQWKRGASCTFISFQDCADYKNAMMAALKNGEVKGPAFTPEVEDWNYRVYWNGRCVQE